MMNSVTLVTEVPSGRWSLKQMWSYPEIETSLVMWSWTEMIVYLLLWSTQRSSMSGLYQDISGHGSALKCLWLGLQSRIIWQFVVSVTSMQCCLWVLYATHSFMHVPLRHTDQWHFWTIQLMNSLGDILRDCCELCLKWKLKWTLSLSWEAFPIAPVSPSLCAVLCTRSETLTAWMLIYATWERWRQPVWPCDWFGLFLTYVAKCCSRPF